LGDSINQRFTALGGGAKFQLTQVLNLEVIYTNFITGKNSGLGQTFNLGFGLIVENNNFMSAKTELKIFGTTIKNPRANKA